MAAKKVVPSKGVRRTDGSSQRAESQRQAGMRRPVPVDRMASQRREAAAMAVKPLSTGQRIANLVFGPPPGSKVRMPDGTSGTLQYGVPASGLVGLGRTIAGAGMRAIARGARNESAPVSQPSSTSGGYRRSPLDWDPKPYNEIPSEGRANIYWKTESDIQHPTDPNVSYTATIHPANPKASPYSSRANDQGYIVSVNRYDSDAFNRSLDSAAEYNKIVGNKIPTENAPSASQFMRNLTDEFYSTRPNAPKVIKNKSTAEQIAEAIIRRNVRGQSVTRRGPR